jgi:hypothetical protein
MYDLTMFLSVALGFAAAVTAHQHPWLAAGAGVGAVFFFVLDGGDEYD